MLANAPLSTLILTSRVQLALTVVSRIYIPVCFCPNGPADGGWRAGVGRRSDECETGGGGGSDGDQTGIGRGSEGGRTGVGREAEADGVGIAAGSDGG